ncbi:MAG: hypothetical protein AMXMBFR45_02210 [Gammaproteobacteria bacterium]|nr:MAG: hypothetical protein BroJett010_24860 [Gammaproteobacteria bacterium]
MVRHCSARGAERRRHYNAAMSRAPRLQPFAPLFGLLLLAAGSYLGWAARFMVIEPQSLHTLCEAAAPPALCAVRDALIVLTFPPHYGQAGLALAVLAWFTRRRTAAGFAAAALFVGGAGLYLYDPAWSVPAVLAALLRLPRIGEEPPDPREFSA